MVALGATSQTPRVMENEVNDALRIHYCASEAVPATAEDDHGNSGFAVASRDVGD
jgi:hypothetical protein